MRILADLHIHSPYSRATSRDLHLENIYVWAQKKGLSLVGTGDSTHPKWMKEILEKLEPAEDGLWRLKPDLAASVESLVPLACKAEVRFVLQTEISTIYKKRGRVRKVHHIVILPDRISMDKLVSRLEKIGNLSADGRPILGLDSRDLLELVLDVTEAAIFIPAHVWTPWFSVFGANSGFDSLEECYEDLTPHIKALETGLSSDPGMNRRWSRLDSFTLVSNSDAHSASRLGREATVLDIPLSYEGLKRAIETSEGLVGTVEFFPEEGKYHLDGHRACGICMTPDETEETKGLCPKCGKPVTVGVLHRVEELCDRGREDIPEGKSKYWRLIPLEEILSELLGSGKASKKVHSLYNGIIGRFGPEIEFLMEFPTGRLEEAGMSILAMALERMRKGEVILKPGFDGQYGRITLFHERELAMARGQMSLMDFSELVVQGQRASSELKEFQKISESERQGGLRDPVEEGVFLDPHQRRAVESEAGAILIVAGPGTGKTRVLTHRIAELIRKGKVEPERILAVTFTQRAALEMRKRLENLLGTQGYSQRMRVQTLHAWGFEFIRRFWNLMGLKAEPSVADEAARRWALEAALRRAGKIGSVSERGRALESISWLKRGKAAPWPEDLLEFYNSELREANLVDYDDLLLMPLKLLQERRDIREKVKEEVGHLFIDEFQDLNPLQIALLDHLIGPQTPLTVVGDPDQSIYGFLGASPKSFLELTERIPHLVTSLLETNYRSKAEIVLAASTIISRNGSLLKRSLVPKRPYGGKISLYMASNETDEAIFVAREIEKILGGTSHWAMHSLASGPEGEPEFGFGDVAVLCRVHHLLPYFQEIIEAHGIPCLRWAPKEEEEASAVDLLVVALRRIVGMDIPSGWNPLRDGLEKMPNSSMEPRQILGELIPILEKIHPKSFGTGKADGSLWRFSEALQSWTGDLRSFLDYWSMISYEEQSVVKADKVSLMTVHGAKGLEFPVVFVVGCEEGIFPLFSEGVDTKDLEEERRLFFVAMTRAKELLYLTGSTRRSFPGTLRSLGPSRFLREIPKELLTLVEPPKETPKPRQLNLF